MRALRRPRSARPASANARRPEDAPPVKRPTPASATGSKGSHPQDPGPSEGTSASSQQGPHVAWGHSYGPDIPPRALEPKVLVPFVHRKGQLPGRIHIERRRRLFQQQDVAGLLRGAGVDLAMLGASSAAPLPPELFDDTAFDSRSPSEWLSLGNREDGSFAFVPAKGLRCQPSTGEWGFEPCRVVAWDRVQNRLRVKWGTVTSPEGEEGWLPRLCVRFLAEDARVYVRRVTAALHQRERAVGVMKFRLLADSMPVEDGTHGLEEDMVERIRARGVLNGFHQPGMQQPDTTAKVEGLVAELRLDWGRAMNRLLLEERLRTDQDGVRVEVLEDIGLELTDLLTPIPTLVPADGLVEASLSEPFATTVQRLHFHSFLTHPEVIHALASVRRECLAVMQGCLFNIPKARTMRLDEFEGMQLQAVERCQVYLKTTWKDALKTILLSGLKGLGKGWMNLQERRLDTYEISKLRRLLTAVKFMMEDSLHALVKKSLREFVDFVEYICDFDVTVVNMNCVEVSYAGSAPGAKVDKNPMFLVELVESRGDFSYSTHILRFEEAFVGLFDRAILATHDIPQLERYVMEQYFWHVEAKGPFLDSVALEDPEAEAGRARIRAALRRSLEPLVEYLRTYDEMRDLVTLDKQAYVRTFEEEGHSTEEMRAEILRHLKRKKAVLQQIPYYVQVGNYSVDAHNFRHVVAHKCQELAKLIMDLLNRLARQRSNRIREEFVRIAGRCQKKATTVEVLFQTQDYLRTVPDAVQELKAAIQDMLTYYNLLESFQYGLADDDFKAKWEALGWPKRMAGIVEVVAASLEADATRFQEVMVVEEEQFQHDVDRLQRAVATFSKHTDISQIAEISSQVKILQKASRDAQEKALDFNKKQQLLGMEVRSYHQVVELNRELQPYALLWITSHDWQTAHHTWHTDPFETLSADQIERVVQHSQKTMAQLAKIFREKPPVLRIVEEIRKSVEEFRPMVPLVLALRNPGMKDRHWAQLSQALGTTLYPKDTLNALADVYPLLPQKELVLRSCELAAREWEIESKLADLRTYWETQAMQLEEHKATKAYILRGHDDLQGVMDEHLSVVQQLSFSPFKQYFAEQIQRWEADLRLMLDILEQWTEVQRTWLYLDPIFAAEDIAVQLPALSKRFAKVNQVWKRIMGLAHSSRSVHAFCTSNPKVLDHLREANKQLESIHNGLQDYLGDKRQLFARFYFLSDDELLELLSQCGDPRGIQPHLKKIFEFIDRLHLGPSTTQVTFTHFQSAEGEVVPLAQELRPAGKVEAWLGTLQQAIKDALREQLALAVHDHSQVPRLQWVLRWPGQVVLAVGQVVWTAECEAALRDGGSAGLAAYAPVLHARLMEIVQLVQGDQLPHQRINLGALITIELHARDVVDRMAAEKVESINDFQWISQLRYYWEKNEVCKVRQVDSAFHYGLEYLGNTSRLVITPLTDRIYLTLTGALAMFQGGAPAGPAGTGKTETCKDLAKALAKQCVVFNCQEGLDFRAMAKFFKGLAMAGAWACFDEFNRIDEEVLSVVAQQVTDLQQAAQGGHYRLLFEGSEIVVDPTFAVFITMNPGYAGRTELPDNLKVLFRPVACMVPDYTMIAEIRLFSFGYAEARLLARKITATFRLSSEQLSSQDHYDFGMRAVNTVISAAGLLRREHPDDPEDALVLRALESSNLPKFLAEDIVLFRGIIGDLFPGLTVPPRDHSVLLDALAKALGEAHLVAVPTFTAKCLQLYEITVLRHGVMVVGPAGGGKTTCLRALQRASAFLAEGPKAHRAKYPPIRLATCNPKSITISQLYGAFDEATNEWADGVLCTLFRRAAQDTSGRWNWIMFDGPVDALWIESMNTVLDENRRLCLVSGEIIQMSKGMTMMFEVEDLAVASPATVSRCGMVYMDPATCVGTAAQFQAWQLRLPKGFAPLQKDIARLADFFLEWGCDAVYTQCTEWVPTVRNNLVGSHCHLFGALLAPHAGGSAAAALPTEAQKPLEAALPALFLFALIWSVGATSVNASRLVFDRLLRRRMREASPVVQIPDANPWPLVYDYRYVVEEDRWDPWLSSVEYRVPEGAAYHDIIVPTQDTVRSNWLLHLLVTNKVHSIFVGPTGSGKTVNTLGVLNGGLGDSYVPLVVNFSAHTSANMLQTNLMSKFEKRKTDTYGPPLGQTFAVFIDDLNLPQRETYGAQPPLELLRQFLDHHGWYQYTYPIRFVELVHLVLVGAMGPPGGGRNAVSNRVLRHFNFVAYPEVDAGSLRTIFGTILHAALSRPLFPEAVQGGVPPTVAATVALYEGVVARFLPFPATVHYTFNLRDVWRVFALIYAAPPTALPTLKHLIRFWGHECRRVFSDRLINDEDRAAFQALLEQQVEAQFGLRWAEVCDTERLLFCAFAPAGDDARSYGEVPHLDAFVQSMELHATTYAAHHSCPPLIMFLDAIEHVLRISRALCQYSGHVLLVGAGGSGRRSLARLAAHIAEFELVTVEAAKGSGLAEWRDALRRLLLSAGLEDRQQALLLSDTQLVRDSFLEDISTILNNGDVPNLFDANDLEQIYTQMRLTASLDGQAATKAGLYARFNQAVKRSLHVLLAFSPIGEAFRVRLRTFPALTNCCSIDWFSPWPEEALTTVAQNALAQSTCDLVEEMRDQVCHVAVYMYTSVLEMSTHYLADMKRHNYVTPACFLLSVVTFIRMMREKSADILYHKRRLEGGLERLHQTEGQVEDLQVSLQQSQPVLLKTAEDIKVMMEELAADRVAAAEQRARCVQDEAEAAAKAEECKGIRAAAQAVLDQALPGLESAVKVLKNLKLKDLQEVAKYQSPPDGVKFVMEVVCKMKGVHPKRSADPAKKDMWWEASRQILAQAAELQSFMLNYDRDNIPESLITKIRPYIEDERFQPAKVRDVSVPCTAMCQWVHAMYKYYHVNLQVIPKRAALAEAEAQLAQVQESLLQARASLLAVEARIQELETNHEAALRRQAALQEEVRQTEVKLQLANRLIHGLSGEKDRWQQATKQYEETAAHALGDNLLAAGATAYFGVFTQAYRQDLQKLWLTEIETLNIDHSPGCTLPLVASDPVTIQQWQLQGLPSDAVSVENAVILANSARWPLCIDPQGQATAWIKRQHQAEELVVCKAIDKDYHRQLEAAIRNGQPFLLEHVPEELDPLLDPVLLRQTSVVGTTVMMRVGDNLVPFHDEFRLYLTTKLPNPHFGPDTCVKVTVLNFFITPTGLEAQLLGRLVAKERRDLEEEKQALTESNAAMAHGLKQLQESILRMLEEAEGDILEQVDLIDSLEKSRDKTQEMEEKMAIQAATEATIDSMRNEYRPVAATASSIFFCISSLAGVDPMYQYSLQWFLALFSAGIDNAEASDVLEERLAHLRDFVTYSFYCNVCRSLFEAHKLVFSFLLCATMLRADGALDEQEWRYLLTGSTSRTPAQPNPAKEWLLDESWADLQYVSATLPAFKGFAASFAASLPHYRRYFDSPEAHRHPLAREWQARLTPFQRLIVLKCLRPDLVLIGVQDLVTHHLGQKYILAPSFNLAHSYKDSDCCSPLLFILSSGADPMHDLLKFAELMKMSRKMHAISLGQGQGRKAEALIQEGRERGSWVLLQNCHLAVTWLPTLEALVEHFTPEAAKREFRLWLTSMPCPAFPVTVLQVSVKMTNEPPQGLRSNVLGSFLALRDDALEAEGVHGEALRPLLFALCFFHAVILERRRFGPLGWNIPYEFTAADLSICIRQLRHFLQVYDPIQYDVLTFLTGQINYGGRVTDDLDRRCLMTLLARFLCPEALVVGYRFSDREEYRTIDATTRAQYIAYVQDWPLNPHPEIFGLHANADITCARNETARVLGTILSLQLGGGGGGSTKQEDALKDFTASLLPRLPKPFDVRAILAKYPILHSQSMNTVLVQEAERFNRLLLLMHRSLAELARALKGEVVMSQELELMGGSMYYNQVPALWGARAYPSLRPLSSWIEDLIQRCDFIQRWHDRGPPAVFWISGFFFPQGFLTGALQNHARAHSTSIDTISFGFQMMDGPAASFAAPVEGVLIHGLHMEGARWEAASGAIAEPRPKELFAAMPVVWLRPAANRPPPAGRYACPVYKTLARAGTLSTTGHSTNFVLMMDVPSGTAEAHWIRRGVACFCEVVL